MSVLQVCHYGAWPKARRYLHERKAGSLEVQGVSACEAVGFEKSEVGGMRCTHCLEIQRECVSSWVSVSEAVVACVLLQAQVCRGSFLVSWIARVGDEVSRRYSQACTIGRLPGADNLAA